MRRLLLLSLALVFAAPAVAQDATSDAAAHAVLPLPEADRADARVLGQTADGTLMTLREGTNGFTCLADAPGDDRFHAACYHNSLEPYMARGRALREEGITGPDSIERRHQEAEAGTLQMPEAPAALYSITMPLDQFDPATAAVTLYAIYTPYATEAGTGLPIRPAAPGAPWLMRPGTPTAHIMIIPVVQK